MMGITTTVGADLRVCPKQRQTRRFSPTGGNLVMTNNGRIYKQGRTRRSAPTDGNEFGDDTQRGDVQARADTQVRPYGLICFR